MCKTMEKISAKILLPLIVFLFTFLLGSYCAPNEKETVIDEQEGDETRVEACINIYSPVKIDPTPQVMVSVARAVKKEASQADDLEYPLFAPDQDGAPLEGSNKYVIHYSRAELPPAGAVWSIVLYDKKNYMVAHKIHRFGKVDNLNLKHNNDGSLDIYIQSDSPGADKESNWLPSPAKGKIGITMRLYMPRNGTLAGRWLSLSVRKVQ